MAFTLPDLPFAYDALEPDMTKETFEYHHDKHHNAYVNKANELTDNKYTNDDLVQVVKDSFKNDKKLFNQVGQHYNHSLFWECLSPDEGRTDVPGDLGRAIDDTWGSLNEFKDKFVEAGTGQFGSGWVWLVMDDNGNLEITSTTDAETPLTEGKTPLLVCDVWEHAYYIDYRNDRGAFLKKFINSMVNWETAVERYDSGPLKQAA